MEDLPRFWRARDPTSREASHPGGRSPSVRRYRRCFTSATGGGRRGHPARRRVAEDRRWNLRCRLLTATPVGVPSIVAHVATSFDRDWNRVRSCRLPATGGGAGRPWATLPESRPLRLEGRILEASSRLSRDRAPMLVAASTPTLRLRDPLSLGEEAQPAPLVRSFSPTSATASGAAVTYLRAAFRQLAAFLCPARPEGRRWLAHVPLGACAATCASRRFRRAACLIRNARGAAPRSAVSTGLPALEGRAFRLPAMTFRPSQVLEDTHPFGRYRAALFRATPTLGSAFTVRPSDQLARRRTCSVRLPAPARGERAFVERALSLTVNLPAREGVQVFSLTADRVAAVDNRILSPSRSVVNV